MLTCLSGNRQIDIDEYRSAEQIQWGIINN